MNPFELRYSLINTAKDLLTQQYEAQMKIWETTSKTVEKFTEAAPKFPTAEEIIEQAIDKTCITACRYIFLILIHIYNYI